MQENEVQNDVVVKPEEIPTETTIREKKIGHGRRYLIIIVIGIIAILIVGITIYLHLAPHLQTATNNAAEPKNSMFNLVGGTFAQYTETKSTITPILQPYTIKDAELTNLNAVASDANMQFSQAQLASLEMPGFFIQPTHPKTTDPNTILDRPDGGRSDDMVDLYTQIGGSYFSWERKPENAVFVTTDLLLHTYHVLIDRTFQNIESVKMQPTLKQLTQVLYKDALAKYEGEQDKNLKDSWKRISVFYLVPLVLLDASLNKPTQYFNSPQEQEKYLQDDQTVDSFANVQKQLQTYKGTTPPEIYQLANQEVALIMDAKAFNVPSPLYGSLTPGVTQDYTQYTPRSHYTRNSVLRSYFRTMIWYGRNGFTLNNIALTRDATLMTWQLGSDTVAGQPALQAWEQIYLPTVFFVGKSDDLTVYDYSDLMKKIYGASIPYSSLSDIAKLQEFQTQAQKLSGPKILSDIKIIDPNNPPTKDQLLQSTKGFRFMGQRFIPDSYIFASLTQGDEKPDPQTKQFLPSTPTALMVMSILGSNTADTLLTNWIAGNAPQSNKVIAKVKNQLKGQFDKFDEKTWTQNIYWAWLYNLRPLFADHNDGYPMFMRGLPWAEKSLVTALGSWTELRHDTLLYAKQSFAELGGGGDHPTPPPVPKGYVEPNTDFITRLIALTTMTENGLYSKGLFVPGQKEKFDSFLKSLQFFKSIEEKELTNTIISDDDYEKLRTIITLDYPGIVWTVNGDQMTERDARTGIIADVHTDATLGKVLYEATGAPSIMYVAVKDTNGTRLTRGVTYSYYEFTQPVGARMTDEAWQGMIYDGKNADQIPQAPDWTKDLIKP